MSKAVFAIAFLIIMVEATAASKPWDPPIPSKLRAHIEATIPGSYVVRPDEIDSEACKSVGSSPTVAHGDLAGNHRSDFAILLNTKNIDEHVVWQGKSLTKAQFELRLFTDDGHGSYVERVLEGFTDFLPLAVYVNLQPPGKIHDVVANRDIRTDHPAVSLVFCEKSEAAYYINNNTVRKVPISD
jgi:hypothetical protein